MNRNIRTVAKIATIIFSTAVFTILAYHVCSMMTGQELAAASNNMPYSRWQEKFFLVAALTGLVTGLCSLLWYGFTRWGLIDEAESEGRPAIWFVLAAISLVCNILIPQFYSDLLGIKINGIVIIMFIAFFTVFSYWLLSIFTTPKTFKHAPVSTILMPKVA